MTTGTPIVSAMALLLFAMAGLVVTATMAVRDHRRAKARRLALFDECRARIETARVQVDAAGFPRMLARHRDRVLCAELVPDTMTIRRLPQLWLSVSLLSASRRRPGFAVLNRPSGNDYYSMTSHFPDQLAPPSGLPVEVLVRGEGADAKRVLDALAPVLAEIFAEPRVKEVAVTDKGLRIVMQNAEGRRGEHLLLRQATFDEAEVAPELLCEVLLRLDRLEAALHRIEQEEPQQRPQPVSRPPVAMQIPA